MLGIAANQEGKIVILSAQLSSHIKVRTIDVKLEQGERLQAVKSYADVTREDVQTPLGHNRHIII